MKGRQAQRRAAAETVAFIRVVRYNDESSFNLDDDFEMNPVSTKTWPHMGPIWATIWAPYEQPIWGPYGFCPPVSYGSHVGSQILSTFLPSRARYGFAPPV